MSNVISIDAARKRPTFKLTEMGNAERFAAQHQDKARYVHPWKCWLVWDGKRWEPDARGAVERLAKETVRSIDEDLLREQDDDKKKPLRAWATKSETRSGRDSMIALAQSELSAVPEDFDRDPWLFNVASGTIDLRSGKLQPHRREDMLTRFVDIAYDATAECASWVSFVTKALGGDAELVAYVQKAIGYTLTGSVKEKCFFFMHGPTDTGKTTFGELLLRLLDAYAKVTGPELLMAREQEQHLTWVADLHGARLAICQEIAEGKRWNERLLKQLTGGDALTANRMHKDPFTFAPSHKIWIGGNHKPKVQAGDDATWNRVRLLPFVVQIPKAEQDRELKGRLAAELPGILRWAVEGCLRWQAEGLEAPKAVLAATEEYREQSDHVATFVDDRLTIGEGETAPKAALYEAYTLWCKCNRETPLSREALSKRLQDRGLSEKKGAQGRRDWIGVSLRGASLPAV
jgi:putative DNA primase/helicase